ncbi:O-methyltransferase-domain-containing protein [Xylaria bambusicola]|uniref:O-methyltransferase-domain-containing protein n=1 Tax=Xylaria bambusicola TaxID=326684 RepID=UPI002008700B|nr:O-methyltransferase-domain-containing protein [Xylaria bambusicola]KAI0505651.1 O-methyltransferase-domain-containing protein [Xylaria bambusicola]
MALSESATRIVRLASTISDTVAKLDEVLISQGLQTPSFDEDAATSFPEEALAMQSVLLDATSKLHDLLLSPIALLLNKTTINDSLFHIDSYTKQHMPFHFISHLGIADMVPLGGSASFQEVAAKTGLNEVIIRRVLRHAITIRVFQEPEPGMLAHTNISKAIIDSSLNDWLKTVSRDLWPAATKTFDAVIGWPNSQEINETAFSLAHNTNCHFEGSLKALTSSPEYDVCHVIDNYDWHSVGHVVDVGGSRGNVAIQLAKNFPALKVLVQDKEEVIQGAENSLPEDIRDRVSFAVHDIFSPQKVEADAYYLRWILHNWPDKYCCILILRALIPALKYNARIIIQEACLPEPGTVPLWKETRLRAADLSMTALFNARDRTVDDWRALFSEADSRFLLKSVIQPMGSALAMMDLRWNGEA